MTLLSTLRRPLGRTALILGASLAMASTCAGSAMGARKHDRSSSVLRRVSTTPLEELVTSSPSQRHWLSGRLPAGGALVDGNVVHTSKKGDSWQSIADDYLELTSIYDPLDLAKEIVKENLPASKNGITPGEQLRIPHVLSRAPKNTTQNGIPNDAVMKGIYVRGSSASGRGYPALLDRVAAHGLNAIVLDVKDSDGSITHPSKVPLAVTSGAVKSPPIRSYARAVRFAHERGISVVARIACFNDTLMSKAHPSMAIRGVSGHVYRNGWLDPKNEAAQQYIVDLVEEAIRAGVDEIQLDYVRFPVIGMKNIDFGIDTKASPGAKIDVITSFVSQVHSITRAHGVPLSLDVFGVIAFGNEVDMQNLGQDPSELGKHAEFLNPMVYPSHYDPGFMGYEQPGDHPELVGMGVKHMILGMEDRGVTSGAKIRPWLQAMHHKSSNYGPDYIRDEIRTGDAAGGRGWLLWNPGQIYDVAWRAVAKPHPSSR